MAWQYTSQRQIIPLGRSFTCKDRHITSRQHQQQHRFAIIMHLWWWNDSRLWYVCRRMRVFNNGWCMGSFWYGTAFSIGCGDRATKPIRLIVFAFWMRNTEICKRSCWCKKNYVKQFGLQMFSCHGKCFNVHFHYAVATLCALVLKISILKYSGCLLLIEMDASAFYEYCADYGPSADYPDVWKGRGIIGTIYLKNLL